VSPGAKDLAPQSEPATATVQPAPSRPDQWLQAIDLPRAREVAPDYPTQAFINGIEGWVDVDFTITPEGVPDNLRVRDSSPRRTFDRAALDSVRQWRFVPILDNGAPVARRATLRVRFQRQ
jgi:protein TonB